MFNFYIICENGGRSQYVLCFVSLFVVGSFVFVHNQQVLGVMLFLSGMQEKFVIFFVTKLLNVYRQTCTS